MNKVSNKKFHSLTPGRYTRGTAWLAMLTMVCAWVPGALANAEIDPYDEGNSAVAGYYEDQEQLFFYVLYAGAQPDEYGLQPGSPGYGDVLFNGGKQYSLLAPNASYIGVANESDPAASRGRVFVQGPDTTLNADGGFYVAGNGSDLYVTDGGRVVSRYGIYVKDSVAGGDTAEIVVSGPGAYLSDDWGEYYVGGRLIVESGVGEARVLVSDGGQVTLKSFNSGVDFESSLARAEISADFEVSGAGSLFETDHLLYLETGAGQSARVLDGARIVQKDDIDDVLSRPVAFTYRGGSSEETGLTVAGSGSAIELINDAVLGDSGFVTLRDGGKLTTQGSVYIEAESPGATKVLLDRGQIDAGGALVIDEGAEVLALNGSTVGGNVNVGGGTLAVERSGLTIAGDLNVASGTLALEVPAAAPPKEFYRSALAVDDGQTPALTVQGNVLFGPDSFIRLLLSSVPHGEILVDDYLLADSIDFAPQFSLAAALDIQLDSDVDLSDGAEFSVRFAGLDQTVAYRYTSVAAVPEIDSSGLPLISGLLLSLWALRRERRKPVEPR